MAWEPVARYDPAAGGGGGDGGAKKRKGGASGGGGDGGAASSAKEGHKKKKKKKDKGEREADGGKARGGGEAGQLGEAGEGGGEAADGIDEEDYDDDDLDGPHCKGKGSKVQRKVAPPKTRGAPVLPWMRVPITIDRGTGVPLGKVGSLDTRIADALGRAGITELFPVQAAVWWEMAGGASGAHDVCVCAPTGSGKTLAYVLPVVQALRARVVPRLRALVVLPTIDLAVQVHTVFQTVCPAVGLSAGLAGQATLHMEQRALMAPGGGGSLVDILICTPGRLMTHVACTPGFTLQHLKFLVVDETDRLLRQSYQDWLPYVVGACAPVEGPPGAAPGEAGGLGEVHCVRRRHGERGAPAPEPRTVKIVLSATLTRDPAKISRLGLHCPRYIATSSSDHRYKLPQQLEEFKLVCPGEMKPLVLLALLQHIPKEPTIVFTSSVEATHRLFLLLSNVEGLPLRVVEYSSLQSPAGRADALRRLKTGRAELLVASDAVTRGIDIEGVGTVINYDVPVYAKTYVHRVGRTARAGRGGRCFSLLRKEDARHFRDMLRKADHNVVRDYQLPDAALDTWKSLYTDALGRLKSAVAAEAAWKTSAASGGGSGGGAGAGGGGGRVEVVLREQAAASFRAQARGEGK